MKILVKLLRNYDCSGAVTPSDPGHILMRHMLNNSQFLKKVKSVLSRVHNISIESVSNRLYTLYKCTESSITSILPDLINTLLWITILLIDDDRLELYGLY